MKNLKTLFTVLALSLTVCTTIVAQPPTFKSLWKSSCMIRQDKFNYVLPKAMRQNNIDMWIVIDNGRGTEPMMLDFAIGTSYGHGIYVFFDNGSDHIERYSLGGPGSSKMMDICGAFDEVPEDGDLRAIVHKRDPKRIALNYLELDFRGDEGMHNADGLSKRNYEFLKKELGTKYAKRFVSAQDLIADYRGEHVVGEIIEFSKAAEITANLLDRAFSNEVITPGVTTQFQVEMWLEEEREKLGIDRTWLAGMWSVESGFRDYEKYPLASGEDQIIQPGDILGVDWGVLRNHYATDMKRFAYVLRDGEVEPPHALVEAFEAAMHIRSLIKKNVVVGKTGREQLDALKQIVRDAGYIYTEDERPSDAEGIEVNIGMHGMGNVAHDLGASLFELSPDQITDVVRLNAFLALEYRIFVPCKEWGNKKIPIDIEENVVITENGLEWVHPPQSEILVIR